MRTKRRLEREELMVPVSIFCSDLSPLESMVKYLREEEKMSYSAMQEHLLRDQRVLAITYKRTIRKYPARFLKKGFYIPVMIINDKLSVMESLVFFLRANAGLSYAHIGELLGKNYHTVRTSYLRASKKQYLS